MRTVLLLRCTALLQKEYYHSSARNHRRFNYAEIDHFLAVKQQAILETLPLSVWCEKITLEEFFKEIRGFPDQDFVEFLDELSLIAVPKARGGDEETSVLSGVVFRYNAFGERMLGESILAAIRQAKERIYLISPAVEMFDELRQEIKKAIRRGIEIRLLTQLTASKKAYPPLPTRGIPNEGHREDHVREMTVLGVLCRQPQYYCHAKMVLTDSEVIISSANLNPNSLGYGANSIEAGLCSCDPLLVHFAQGIFDAVWQSSPTRQHLHGIKVNITENPAKSIASNVLEREIDGWKLLLSVPPDRYTLTQELVRSIGAAQKTVRLCTHAIYDTIQVPTLHASLLSACQRNVDVTILVRRDNFKACQWADPSTEELLQNGVRIQFVDGFHAKLLVVDDNRFGCFSGNLNPYSLSNTEPTAHLEIGLFGFHSPTYEAINSFIDQCEHTASSVATGNSHR